MMTGELKTKIENIWDIWNMQKNRSLQNLVHG